MTTQPRMPWEAEVRVDVALARRLVASQFPALATLPLRTFGEGWDNVAYLLGERWIFRFPRRAVAAVLIETELRVLPQIAPRLPLPVPVPRFAGVSGEAFPWPFAGYELLPGDSLSRSRLDERAAKRAAHRVGEFLRALHAIDSDGVLGLDVDRIGRLEHARCMPKVMERLQELADAGIIDDIEPFERILEETAPPASAREPLVIVHGDLYGRHVLVDGESHVCGVIDWGDVHRGDPAVDLAAAFEAFPPAAREAFASAYGAASDRTWASARYRALYHSAMVAHYGLRIGDREMLRAGLTGLSSCRV
jgi:aminoglycoside phosphotransferase (APT) family kinase protein